MSIQTFIFFYHSDPDEFLCEDNFCIRGRQNSKYDVDKWIVNQSNKGANFIQCNNVIDCPDGSDESSVYSSCENINGNWKCSFIQTSKSSQNNNRTFLQKFTS